MIKIGLDIGGTKVNAGLVDETGVILAKRKFSVPPGGVSAVLEEIGRELDGLLAGAGYTYADAAFCGVGVPGTVSADGRTVVKAPNLGWFDVPAAEAFERMTGLPVRLVQDSRAAAWGEYKAGRAQGKRVVMCFTLGTGLGTGIVIDGKIYHGGLGASGEIGHNPVEENGRPCGCGKRGCLEKYTTGLGLETSAREAFGAGVSVRDLFDRAFADPRAASIIRDAVTRLGAAISSAVNLLSPDCVLLSGGLSAQRDLFARPLMEYVRAHSYAAGDGQMTLDYAALGEDAPMMGAALLPYTVRRAPALSPSVMCADLFDIKPTLEALRDPRVKYLHCDVMDGHFVPNLMLPPELINRLKKLTDIPLDVHLMTDKPELVLPLLDIGAGDVVSVHAESTPHIKRIVADIKARGARAAVAINPGTPVESVRDVLNDVDFVLVMTVNPGFAGQPLAPGSLDKIRAVRDYLDGHGFSHVGIEVDGNCSFDNIPKMYRAGADLFVSGTSGVFHKDHTVSEAIGRIYKSLEE